MIVKGPVCGMEIDPKMAVGKSKYKGQSSNLCMSDLLDKLWKASLRTVYHAELIYLLCHVRQKCIVQ
jgi:hypothetical protein